MCNKPLALARLVCSDCNRSCRYIALDPDTECNASDPTYRGILGVSIFGIMVYCGVLPVSIYLVLTSRWCRKMYAHERAGYEGMIGFLTTRYARKAFLWELVVFLKKFCAAAIPIYLSSSKISQCVLSMVTYFVYLIAVFKSYPLATLKLNHIEIVNNLSLFLMYFFSILVTGSVDGQPILSGSIKTVISLVLAALCVFAVVHGVFATLYDITSLLVIHRNSFASHWIKQMSLNWGATTEQGIIPFMFALYSPVSRRDIFQHKDSTKKQLKEARQTLEEKYPAPRNFWLPPLYSLDSASML